MENDMVMKKKMMMMEQKRKRKRGVCIEDHRQLQDLRELACYASHMNIKLHARKGKGVSETQSKETESVAASTETPRQNTSESIIVSLEKCHGSHQQPPQKLSR
ncbi:hypothetical protein PHAVU_002G045000 [Phaseolus vulgaris]|uniref:Uncharacterized protein n=1 Tax=Phaseolus vulgaris TaxID=3885 RepID=V7CG43_PHAVU|nr:hypothetical protein PHAVU_002G045000g [Phaseolus vulgaris]ESW29119.1 hypothetical protein PHAVU_002G045000g [Phaseolus vulgaris]